MNDICVFNIKYLSNLLLLIILFVKKDALHIARWRTRPLKIQKTDCCTRI